jgi:hypothetical protein
MTRLRKMMLEELQARNFSEMGHRDLLVTHNLAQRSSNTAPLASRVASAAGRLRPNAFTGQVP